MYIKAVMATLNTLALFVWYWMSLLRYSTMKALGTAGWT
jgi:hypothetical protein